MRVKLLESRGNVDLVLYLGTMDSSCRAQYEIHERGRTLASFQWDPTSAYTLPETAEMAWASYDRVAPARGEGIFCMLCCTTYATAAAWDAHVTDCLDAASE